jgi:hypothetical protein
VELYHNFLPHSQHVCWYGAELIAGTTGWYDFFKFDVLLVGEGDTIFCELKYNITFISRLMHKYTNLDVKIYVV